MAGHIRLFGTIFDRRVLRHLLRQSVLPIRQQIGKHLHYSDKIRSMDQICSRNRRIAIEYAKFHGKLNHRIIVIHINSGIRTLLNNVDFILLGHDWNRRTKYQRYASVPISFSELRSS